jgi:hypothetical protein
VTGYYLAKMQKVSKTQKCTVPLIKKWAITIDTKNCDLEKGCDDPTRINTLRKYVGQAEDKTSVQTVRAKQ